MSNGGFLEVRSGGQVRHVPVSQSVVSIGRGSDNVLSLDDGLASRHHARLDNVGGVLTLTDLGSSNGTSVNGIKIQPNVPTRLRDGDTISIGGTTLVPRLSAAVGQDTVVTSGAPGGTAYGAPPATYVPPQPVFVAPSQPPAPQVVQVQVPGAEAVAKPVSKGLTTGAWVGIAAGIVGLLIFMNIPIFTATKTVTVEKPQMQTVTKTVMRNVTREVPVTTEGEKTINVYVGYIRTLISTTNINTDNQIVDYTRITNSRGLWDVTTTAYNERQEVYRDTIAFTLDKTGQAKVPAKITSTKTVTEQVPEQVQEQVQVMVKEDVEKKVKVSLLQQMTGDY